MIRISNQPLPNETALQLNRYQQEVDVYAEYAERVLNAGILFKRYNTIGNETFDTIKQSLDMICVGAKRCMYCEDSAADEVEHFKPKQFYPEETFRWHNYLYSCGQCNVAKKDNFAILDSAGQVIHLKRKRNDLPAPPPLGTGILIYPRGEDPADFLELDITDTFLFTPRFGLSDLHLSRARYTISALKLNRDLLIRARREAYNTYRARLTEYVQIKQSGEDADRLPDLELQFKQLQHQSVWIEMRRKRHSIDHLNRLFEQSVELLNN